MGFWFDEKPGQILMSAISGVVPHTLFVYISLLLDSWNSNRSAKKNEAIELSNAGDRFWEENEQLVITAILKNYQRVDLNASARNKMFEENLARLSTEEIVDRLNRNNFSEDSIPSALRVLSNRLKN